MLTKRTQQLGLFLATAGASLLLSGAAHADSGDVTSPSQSNQTSSNQQVVVTDQSTTTSSVNQTQSQSGQSAGTTAPPSPPSGGQPSATVSPEPGVVPPSSSSDNSTPAVGAQPAGESTYTPVPVPATFFRPVTIISALVPTVVNDGRGQPVIEMPDVAPAKPAIPELPLPTGALGHVSQLLGKFTLPIFGWLSGLFQAVLAWPVWLMLTNLMLATMAFITFASLLRRWGYAISSRGSDPRLQLAYEFASPAMSELVPVRTKYPG